MPVIKPPVPILGQPSLLHALAALPPYRKASPKLSLFSFTFTSGDLETCKHIEIGLQRFGMCTSMGIKLEVHCITLISMNGLIVIAP